MWSQYPLFWLYFQDRFYGECLFFHALLFQLVNVRICFGGFFFLSGGVSVDVSDNKFLAPGTWHLGAIWWGINFMGTFLHLWGIYCDCWYMVGFIRMERNTIVDWDPCPLSLPCQEGQWITAALYWVHFLGARNRLSMLCVLSHLIITSFLWGVCHYHQLKFTDEETGTESSSTLPNTTQLVEHYSGFELRKTFGQNSLAYDVMVTLGEMNLSWDVPAFWYDAWKQV